MGNGFENYNMAWLSKNHPGEAKRIFEGKTTMKDKNAGTGKEMKPNKGKGFIELVLMGYELNYEKEYQFARPRKFRFDFCFWTSTPKMGNMKVAIEYEGIFTGKSRHTTFSGYTDDSTKYNIAAIDGWIVLRYTARSYKNFAKDLETLLK